MKFALILSLLSALIAQGSPPTSEDKPPEQSPSAEENVEPQIDGLWPSPHLMELLIVRWAEEASEKYELDDDQRTQLRKAVLDRWTGFFEEHEEEIRPLFSRFLEMRLNIDPPPKEDVQNWAKDTLPLFEQMRGELENTSNDFREVMTPPQRARFELELFKHSAGLQFVENKLRAWSEGRVEPDDLWEPIGQRERRRERSSPTGATERSAKRPEAQEPRDPISRELATWEQYVQAFIAAYDLNEGQRTTALSCLRELQERAKAHRERYADEIEALEARIANNGGTEEELASIESELKVVYGPVDEMFRELETRLRMILTVEQQSKPFAFPAADEPTQKTSDAQKEERRKGP